jgi:hypothetical protein
LHDLEGEACMSPSKLQAVLTTRDEDTPKTPAVSRDQGVARKALLLKPLGASSASGVAGQVRLGDKGTQIIFIEVQRCGNVLRQRIDARQEVASANVDKVGPTLLDNALDIRKHWGGQCAREAGLAIDPKRVKPCPLI